MPALPFTDLPAAVAAAAAEAPSPPPSVGAPHVFYGPCAQKKGNASFAPIPTCAGKAQPTRTKQIASGKRARYVWDHYLRLPESPKTAPATASRHLTLVHARAGYGFDGGAAPARFSVRGDAKAEAAYEAEVRPLVAETCGVRARTGAASCGAARGAYDVCWCRDGNLEARLPSVERALARWWGPT